MIDKMSAYKPCSGSFASYRVLAAIWICVTLSSFTGLSLAGVIKENVPVYEPSTDTKLTGFFYFVDSGSGGVSRLNPCYIRESHLTKKGLKLQLHLVDDQARSEDMLALSVLDIHVQEASVLSPGATLASMGNERKGNNGKEEGDISISNSCFLTGEVKMQGQTLGFISLNHCDGWSGLILTETSIYTITKDANVGVTEGSGDCSPYRPVQVTQTDVPSMEDTLEDDAFESTVVSPELGDDDEEIIDQSDSEDSGSRGNNRQKRDTHHPVVELGIYIASSKAADLKGLGLTTPNLILNWVVNRWNIVKTFYETIDIDIRIKHLEIWWKDPEYYVVPVMNETMLPALKSLCRGPSRKNVDIRLLYLNTRSRAQGMAYRGGICKKNHNCAVVVPVGKFLKPEIHELGHLFHLKHEYAIPGCQKPYGFMAGGYSMTFKRCYIPVLAEGLSPAKSKCVYEENVANPEILVLREGEEEITPIN